MNPLSNPWPSGATVAVAYQIFCTHLEFDDAPVLRKKRLVFFDNLACFDSWFDSMSTFVEGANGDFWIDYFLYAHGPDSLPQYEGHYTIPEGQHVPGIDVRTLLEALPWLRTSALSSIPDNAEVPSTALSVEYYDTAQSDFSVTGRCTVHLYAPFSWLLEKPETHEGDCDDVPPSCPGGQTLLEPRPGPD